MPIQSADTDHVTFTSDNQQWIIKVGVIVAPDDNSIAVRIPTAGARLFNFGNIVATDIAVATVGAVGSSTVIVNGATGTVDGSTGVVVRGPDVALFNDGTIRGAADAGVLFGPSGSVELRNQGYIYGKMFGVRGEFTPSVETFSVFNDGTIASKDKAIRLLSYGGSTTLLDNTGKIRGDVLLGSAVDTVINNGLIRGDVDLGPSDDTYRGRKGALDGVVFGNDGNDVLKGGAADDEFSGGLGSDTISGNGGDDRLIGGGLSDDLKGGSGEDRFVYLEKTDSGLGPASRDTIRDFNASEDDRIDLRGLDAKSGSGDQHFTFIGAGDFSGAKGEVRYYADDGNVVVQLNTDGGVSEDMEILLLNIPRLTAGDFYL